MRLNAPKKIVWIITLLLAIVSLLGYFVHIPVVTKFSYWIMGVAWLLLFLATFLKGF